MNYKIFKLLFLTCFGLVQVQAYDDFDPPTIIPKSVEGYYVYKKGMTAKIRCQGTLHGVSWRFNATESMKRRVTKTNSVNHQHFISELIIRDLNFNDTGTLTCVYNGTVDLTSIDNSASVHLYVEDKEHLLKYSGLDFFYAVQRQTFILPCMPTHPDVNITLFRSGQPVDLKENYISYDPKVGYKISPVTTSLHSGFFECKAKYRGIEDSYSVDMTIRSQSSYVPPPHINDTLARRVTIGQTFSLTCSVIVDFDTVVDLAWDIPNPNVINENRLRDPERTSKNLSLSGTSLKKVLKTLTILKSTKEDQGSYTCTVTDHSGNREMSKVFVRVPYYDEPSLDITFDAYQTLDKTIGVDANQPVQWVVNIHSHPKDKLSLFWIGPDGRKLDDMPGRHNMDYTIKTHLKREPATTMLKVNKLKLSNAGTYTVRVTNGVQTKEEKFKLIIRSEPSAQITMTSPQGLYSLGKEYTMECSAEGFPTPTIQWLFKPCTSWDDCDQHKTTNVANLVERKHELRNIHKKVSTIREVARRSGQFVCQACNQINCVFDKIDFFVTDVDDGFSVFGPKNVLEGQRAKLKCSASSYNFSSIDWYKDVTSGEKKLVSGYRYKIVDTSTDFSMTKTLNIKNLTLGDKGRYVCKGQRLKTPMTSAAVISNSRRSSSNQFALEPSERSFQLNVLPIEIPVLTETNLLRLSQKRRDPIIVANPADGIQLRCKVTGRPLPKITWYLNQKKLRPTIKTQRVQILEDNQLVNISYITSKDEGTYNCTAENSFGITSASHVVLLKSTAERDTLYANIHIPVIVAVVIALLLVVLLIILAKLCYRNKKKTSISNGSPGSTTAWKEPPTPPTPRLTQFELPLTTPPPSSHYSNEDEECRINLPSPHDERNISPLLLPHEAQGPHHNLHPCCNSVYASRNHCHYQALPTHETYLMPPCQMSNISMCDCQSTTSTIPRGTLERQFPHLLPPRNGNAGTLRLGTPLRFATNHRSRSHSPSRRSAEY